MDLHDNTIQALHGAVMSLAAVERSPDAEFEQMRSAVHQVRGQLNTTIRELRQYLCGLRPGGSAANGLSTGLLRLADRIRLNSNVHAEVDIDASVPPLVQDVAVAEHLLAIASEASSNAIRHARARSVAIRLSCTSGRVVLTIADDGRGVDTHARLAATGRGLEHMSERAALLGARLRVRGGANGGTQVSIELPPRADPVLTG